MKSRVYENRSRSAGHPGYHIIATVIALLTMNTMVSANQLNHLPAGTGHSCSGIMEEEISLEAWMGNPFGIPSGEAELEIESWMADPFSISSLDDEIELESWMSDPFRSYEIRQAEEVRPSSLM